MPAVSVVIPLYNTENYFEQTLESIISQTYTDWELIIVDDCSTDNSFQIAEQYAARDKRVRLIKTPTNTGSAKIPFDTGIAIAQSEWICGIGCDDYFDPNTIEKLIGRQQQTDADIVYLKMALFDNTTGEPLNAIPDKSFDFNQVLPGTEAMMLTIGRWQIGANGAMIRRNIWISRSTFNNNEVHHMNADEYDTREMLSMARKVAFVDTSYHYRIHSRSISRNVSPKLFETVVTDRMVAELVERVYGKNSSEHRKAKAIAMNYVLGKYFMQVRYAKQFSKENRQRVGRLIREERERYTCTEIWHSELSILKKLLLTTPRWLSMIPISIFVCLKYRS